MRKTRKTLFSHTLRTNGKKESSIVFIGDIHYGYPTCIIEMVQDMIHYCLKNKYYVIGMGDYIECASRTSPGDSLFVQKGNTQTQMDFMIEMFLPLAKEGLLLGLHRGNHCARAQNTLGIDIVKNMCRELSHHRKAYRCKNFGYSAYHLIRVGNESYEVFTTHGTSGSRMPETKLRALRKFGEYINAELIAMGHVHDMGTTCFDNYAISKTHRRVMWQKKYYVLTGSYLAHEGSYAEMKGMIPGMLGSPKARFMSDTHDIFVSF